MGNKNLTDQPIFLDNYHVEPSGNLDVDLKRIKREPSQENQEYGAHLVFREYCKKKYGLLCLNPESVVTVYQKFKQFIKGQDEDYHDMIINALFRHNEK